MKRDLIFWFVLSSIVVGVWMIAQTPPSPPARTPLEEAVALTISNTVRSCAEEYTKTYVRAYCKAYVAEMSNQLVGVRNATNVVVTLPQSMPQPCEHTWVPMRQYQQEYFCSRCGVKEWK